MPSLISPTGAKFAFGYGRIGVLQQQLLTPSDLDRLLGAHNDLELRRVLSEIKLTSRVMPLEDRKEIILALERWLKNEVEKMSPPGKASVFGILWLREDLPVLAYMLKKFLGYTSSISVAPIVGVTMFPVDRMKELVFEGKNMNGALPEDLVRFVERIRAQKTISPQQIDSEVAQFVAGQQRELARRSGSRLIRRYAAHLIDLQNIRTFHRLGRENPDLFHFVEGGEIDISLLTSNSDRTSLLIRKSTLPDTVLKSIGDESESAVVLERGLNRGLAHDLAEMRAVPLSIEPIFAFAVIALSHILLIRTVLIGKAAKLTSKDISAMLPPFFSTSFAAA